MTPKVALIMGSDSDFEKLKSCVAKLKEFKIEVDVNVILHTEHLTKRQNLPRMPRKTVLRL